MGKRASSCLNGVAVFRKRQKVAHDVPNGEDVQSSDHLRQLLAFDQNLRKVRHGLQSFKSLLDDIMSDKVDRIGKVDILRQYLGAVEPRDTGHDAVFLSDIMDAWSFAVQVIDEGVMSSVAVVLALLLRVVSDSLQLVPHGLGVCRTLLQERQLKSLHRNLSSERAKGFIISPTLRLLREAVCLDGGAYAKSIFRKRAYTFASLSRNLELGHSTEGQEDARKSSVRTNAVRFFLSCLQYLPSDGRRELLMQKELFSRLTHTIKADPAYLMLEILDSLRLYVLMDSKIPREIKSRSFNTKTLMRFLTLYKTAGTSADPAEKDVVSERVDQFLKYICTAPSAGVLYPYKGLYPKNAEDAYSDYPPKGRGECDGDGVRGDWSDKEFSVFNFVLCEFAEKLRPGSNPKHSELLVSIFTAAPELIARYFHDNRTFVFEPKLSSTWIGYAAFLFNTISIPLPPDFGDPVRCAEGPPPTSILLDNILPPAINEKVLLRCLSLKSDLAPLFATRILLAALGKLDAALHMHHLQLPRHTDSRWSEAARRLLDAFCQRIPDLREIVRCYKSIPAENSLHKTMASRLLQLYYKVTPRVALAANFDVSLLFVDVLSDLRRAGSQPKAKSLIVTELESLVSIASYSPGMRWFSLMESPVNEGASSAFTALLQLCADDGETPNHHLGAVLADVAVEHQLISGAAALKPLIGALQCTICQIGRKDMKSVWGFLDNCVGRCASSPIKYLESTEVLLAAENNGVTENRRSSLLNLVLIEQLLYATKSAGEGCVKPLAQFLSLYLNACYLWEDDHVLLGALHRQLKQQLLSSKVKLTALGDAGQISTLKKFGPKADCEAVRGPVVSEGGPAICDSSLRKMLHTPMLDDGDSAILAKWTSKSAEDLIEDEWAATLVRHLLSEHMNIRKEALISIMKVAARVKESSYGNGTQVWLLLSELTESSRALVEFGPVPTAFAAFAIHALQVLQEPLHPLYPKVNAFLTRSPVWSLEKLPLAHDVLHGEPSEDDKYYKELAWLLGYLSDSLRTPFDLGIFHKKKWFEKIIALGSNPYLRSGLRVKLFKIIYRATCIQTGSTTLITRFGILGWLDAQRATCSTGDEVAACEGLIKRVWETCDQERISVWSSGGIDKLVDDAAR